MANAILFPNSISSICEVQLFIICVKKLGLYTFIYSIYAKIMLSLSKHIFFDLSYFMSLTRSIYFEPYTS
jgi:hypothetical protein